MTHQTTRQPADGFETLLTIVRRLRKECPWDREQTPESMRAPFIEEVYEAVEAIERRDWPGLAEELGDVLLNVLFQAVLAEEEARFTIVDVLERESRKLVYRHPHVYGDETAEDAEQVLKNWEQRKRQASDRASILDGVPANLPSLLFAERVQSKAARVGFDFPTVEEAWGKVTEETQELRATDPTDQEAWSEEFGDLLFSLVNVGRLNGLSPEMALRAANIKFTRRFRHVEARLNEQGRSPEDATLEEMDRYWEEAKGADV